MSLAWTFAESPPTFSALSLAVGVAIARVLRVHGAQDVKLKWPNDIVWQGRKLGGILIETVMAGPTRLAVVGIGLNILPQLTDEVSSGYGYLQELDALATAPRTLAQIAVPLVQGLRTFEREGFAPFAERFAARDLLRGRAITTTLAGLPEGVAQGVTPLGALRVQTADGLREVGSGEVSVRLDHGGPPDSGSGALC